MRIKEHITKPRIVAYVISCVIPLLAIGFGVFLLFNDTIFNTSFLIVMIIFPIITAVLLFFAIFTKMRISVKIIVAIFILLVFVVMFLFGFVIGHFEVLSRYEGSEAIEYYASASQQSLLPSFDEVGQPHKIEYFEYYTSEFVIFTNDVHTLICQYTAAEYETQKALLEDTYIFQTAPMTAHEYSCNPTAKIGDYQFRTLAIDGTYGNAIDYPKYMYFVALNDKTYEIVYLSAYDDDLDFIQSLDRFIKVDCGWNRIR